MESVRVRLRHPRISDEAVDSELLIRADRLQVRSVVRGQTMDRTTIPLRSIQTFTREGIFLRVECGKAGAELCTFEIVDDPESEPARIFAAIEYLRAGEVDLESVVDEAMILRGAEVGFGRREFARFVQLGEQLLRAAFFALAKAVGDDEGLEDDEIDYGPLVDGFGGLAEAIAESCAENAKEGVLFAATHSTVSVGAFDALVFAAMQSMVIADDLGDGADIRRALTLIAGRVAAEPGKDWQKYQPHYDGSMFLRSIADETHELANQLASHRATS